jgi:hypothetical protein
MKMRGLLVFGIILILFFSFIAFVSSVQTVIVQQPPPQQEKEKGWFATYFWFLSSPVFWGIIALLILIALVLVGVFFLVRWLVKFFKNQKNVFYSLRTDRVKLARIQRRYPSKHWYKVQKNIPIRLVKIVNNKPYISNPIGNHRGDYMTHEGSVVISMNLTNDKKWFILPVTSLLIVPNKEKIELAQQDEKGKSKVLVIDNLPLAKDIIQFNENEILIYAESISNVGIFYVPVLRAKDGKIIDLSLPVYNSLKEVVMGEYLLEQTNNFVDVSHKSVNMNPILRWQTKVQDSSSSVDLPQGNSPK